MEIEYCAWSRKWNRLIYKHDTEFEIDVNAGTVWQDSVDDENVDLMRCLELRDKYGKKIYEDCSILKFKFLEELDKEIEFIGVFTFNDEDLRYEIDIYNNPRYVCLNYTGNGVFRNFEVIGTKQENPELLKEK
jgi:hypothetical protein